MNSAARRRAAWPCAVLAAATLARGAPARNARRRVAALPFRRRPRAGRGHPRPARGPSRQGPPARLRRRRRRLPRLRPRRSPRHLPRERLEARRLDRSSRRAGTRSTAACPTARFEDVTDKAGVGGEGEWGAGAFVADYDDDGWPDILVTNFGPNLLYRNQGDGTLRERRARGSASSRRAGTPARPSSTPTATATSTSTSPATSTARLDDVLAGEAHARRGRASRWWRSGRSASRARPITTSANDGGALRRRDARGRARGQGARLRLRGARRRHGRRRRSSTSTSPTTPTRTTSIATTARACSRRWPRGPAARFDENGAAQASMGVAWGDVTGDGLARHLRHQLLDGLLDPLRRARAAASSTTCRARRASGR